MLQGTTFPRMDPHRTSPVRRLVRASLGRLGAGVAAAALIVGVISAGCGHAPPKNNDKANRFQAEGVKAYQQGELDRAAGLFSLALEYQPRMAEARLGRGLVLLARGDKVSAEAEFKAALSLNEELAEAHHNLGLLDADRGDFEKAMTRFRQALAIDPGFPAARLAVGDTLLQMGRPDEARWEIVKLTEVEPRNAHAHAMYARILAQLGRVAAAEAAATKALSLDPNLPEAHRAQGELLLKRGDFVAAADEFRLVLKVIPLFVDARVQLATALLAANKQGEVDQELDLLEKQAPASSQVAYLRAYVGIKRNDPVMAVASARRALRLRRTYPEARMLLAEGLFMAGHQEEGKAELKRFLDEAPPSMEEARRSARAFLAR
jgi:tetratricopeptide (TPR) repeat protein